MKAIPIVVGTVHKVNCTEMQVEMLPDGSVRILAFEGYEPFAELLASPSIVIVDNTAVPKLEVVRLVKANLDDELPI